MKLVVFEDYDEPSEAYADYQREVKSQQEACDKPYPNYCKDMQYLDVVEQGLLTLLIGVILVLCILQERNKKD